MAADAWIICNDRCDLPRLAQFNSVGTISNGYLGLKGNLAELREGPSPVTLVHGVYDELDMFGLIRPSNQPRPYLDPRYFDTAGRSPAVANLPNPLLIRTFVNERELSLTRGHVVDFEQSLDLRTGLYGYQYDYHDGTGRTTRVEMQRFAALRHAHRVHVRYRLTPRNHDAPLHVWSGISGAVWANPTRTRQFRVVERWTDPAERCRLVAHLPARHIDVRVGVGNMVRAGDLDGYPFGVTEHDAVYTRYVFRGACERPVELERIVVLTTSEDLRHRAVGDLEQELDAGGALGFDAALTEQRAAWDALWQHSDVEIDGDEDAQRALRFCLHHLLAAAPRFSDRLSVPVKLLSGEHYQGNTFYDTETHILPFYTFTQPQLAQTCLQFRYEGLRPGRELAHNLGHAGVKLAWQAGPYGEECLGRWYRFTHTNIHVNAAVAYALMLYTRVTGDERFLRERGAELLVETARFLASRAQYDAERDRYDLVDVTGPDEGHCGVTNNFYTNYLAAWNLRWAADAVDPATGGAAARAPSIGGRLGVRPDEPQRWRTIADQLTLLYDPQTRIFEQHAGYHALKPLPADFLDERKDWFLSVFPYQAANQPDVLMALALFRDAFAPETLRANWEHYRDKSLNFSSMSFAIHALVAAEIGDMAAAYRNFRITAGMDLDEALTGRHDTHLGLHGTAAGGAWLAAVCGFGGVAVSDAGVRIRPRLPESWQRLRFTIFLRGLEIQVTITPREVTLSTGPGRPGPLSITVAEQDVALRPNETRTIPYASIT